MTNEPNELNIQNEPPKLCKMVSHHRNRPLLRKIVVEGSVVALISFGFIAMYLKCHLLMLAAGIVSLPLGLFILWTLASVSWTSFRHSKNKITIVEEEKKKL